MALSGTFSNKWKGYTYQISWSATQNTSGNYSTITCTHKLICDSTWALYIDGRTITCTINSVNKTVSTSSISTGGGTTITLGTTTHTVNHSSNGSGSFSLSSTFPIQATIQGVYQSSISVSGSATLNTIPRASSMTIPEFTMGTAGTMTINKASSDFTHTITYSFGSKTGTIVNKTSGASASWTPSVSELAGQLPNSTRGYGTLTLITYSGTTEVGRNSYVFYCNVPSNIVPTVGTITLTPTAINGNNILVQGKNKLTINVTGSSAGTGSSIKSYTFSGPDISTTTTSSSVVINSVSTSGTLTYTIKVTDSRGRVTSKTATITCYGYAAPFFNTFEINRDSSNNIKCNYNVSYSTVNSTNKITVKFSYKKASGSWTNIATTLSDSSKTNYTVLSNASDEVYNVRATVTDSYGASVTSSTQTVFGSARIMNIPQGGNGVSFGRKSTVANTTDAGKFEVGWDATFDKNVNIGGNATVKGTASISGNTTMGGTLTTTGAIIPKNNINMGGLNGQTGELQIRFSNPTNSTNPHNVYIYGGNPSNVNAIGCYDGKNNRPVWSYNDGNNSFSIGNGSTTIYFNGAQMADFVISQGMSGAWNIRKWNNGTAECWRSITGTVTKYTTWNNMHGYTGSADFPSGFFIENPNVQYQVYIGSGFAMPARGAASTTSKFTWYALASDGDSNVGYVVDVYAIGRWK